MKFEIGVIAPDKDLYILVKELQKEVKESLIVEVGFLEEAILVAQDLINKGVKVIVSRGGTTTRLREAGIHVPIIDIPITEYDVIKLLNQAKHISRKIGVIGYDSLAKAAQDIAPILGVQVQSFLVQNESEVRSRLKELNRQGISVIIGSKLAVEWANKLGMKGILIKSQKSVVLSALNEAEKVLNALHNEREWGQRLNSILDSIREGIISVDRDGRVTHFNQIAVEIMKFNQDPIVNYHIKDIFKDASLIRAVESGEKWIGEVREVNGTKYACGLNPIIVNDQLLGSIISFQDLSDLQRIEYNVRRNLYKKGHIAKHSFNDIIRRESKLEKIISKAKQYASVDSTVLIQGESGTGKEIFAQSLHNYSRRSGGPFVAINCAALPEHLLESELFGYVDGAFTGARKGGKTGLFELAHKGTLFLDEIGEISLSVQARLLRVIEEKQVMRIGDDRIIPIDVRIYCATNKDLRAEVKKGKFREDLYYRINILKLDIPSLRERREDIPALVEHFNERLSTQLNKNSLLLTKKALEMIASYPWPGNIRQLRNTIERLIVTNESTICCPQIEEALDEAWDSPEANRNAPQQERLILKQEEYNIILKVLEEAGGNKAEACRRLGISKATLWRRLKAFQNETYNIEK
ncbi:sigma-54-dependent Fis family transcriptional regulator [Desulfitibacter alkalitolerans]|uniref:sigma-54-dependent Fis family transcriptional regulator n=1 Tax=Desulfitibacter alkalitolerans TaxID=264641 RepID=UPI0004841D11|nr:sigma-54-dependent Fis family transcriptional regulator [Desulfitibacter alkalitolerans]